MKISKNIMVIGALLVAISVVLGAFGAHALDGMVKASSIESFKTGTDYARFHGLALIIIALIPQAMLSDPQKRRVGLIIFIGTLLFSFSIYLLVMNQVWQQDWIRVMGPITPVGGILMIIGWFLLAHYLFYSKVR